MHRFSARALARTFLLAALTASTPPASAGAQVSLGPLWGEEGAPLQRIALTAVSEDARPVGRGTLGTGIWLGYSNIFERDSTAQRELMIDMERLITTVAVRYGVSDRLEAGARATFESTGGGALDGFVSWWHERLGVGNANREDYPEGVYDYRLEDERRGVLLYVPRTALALEDVRFFAKWLAAASDDGRRLLSLRTTVRLPTRYGEVGREGTDVGVSALGRLSYGRWHAHGSAGAATVRASGPLDALLRDHSYHLMLGAERTLGDTWAAVIQYSVSTPVLASVERRRLDRASANLVVGVAGRVGERWRWDFSFQEDLPPDTPAPDFTFGFRLSRTW